MRTVRENDTGKVVAGTARQLVETCYQIVKLRRAAGLEDNSLMVHHSDRPTLSLDTL